MEVIFTINKTPSLPVGLGMALAQNVDSMNYFSSLSPDEQQEIINHTHTIQSKREMEEYVDEIKCYF